MEQNYVTVNILVIVACSGCVAAVKGQGLAVFKYSERVPTSNFPSATVFSRRESTYIADADATRRGAERCELGKTDNNQTPSQSSSQNNKYCLSTAVTTDKTPDFVACMWTIFDPISCICIIS